MLDIEQFRRAGYQAIDRICEFYYSLEQRDVVSRVQPGYLREALPSHAPEHGEDFQKISDDYQKLIIPGLTIWQHPFFFAYFPTACTFEGMLGDLYASSTMNPGFNWACSPACTELEAVVCDWAAKMLGLEKHFQNENQVGGGVIQATASDSALVAVVAARSRYVHENPEVDHDKLVIYTTTQTHSLGKKAALILGLNSKAIDVSMADELSLRGATFEAVLQEDKAAGKHPFILSEKNHGIYRIQHVLILTMVATVGTTSSGAIDNLSEVFNVAKAHKDLWIHVDAAWAGVAMCCPELREKCFLECINRSANSFCTNFHKWGLTNFDASVLWVRNRKELTNALDITPEFLRTKEGDAGTVIDYRNWHLSLGRRFRSLKLWFVLRSYGVEGFQAYIRKSIELNEHFAKLVQASSELELVTKPSFALSVFRVRTPLEERADVATMADKLTRRLYEHISMRKDILLTQTVINGIFCIRFAVGAARTEVRHIDSAYGLIHEETLKIIDEIIKDR